MSTETFIDGLVRYIKIKEMKKTIEAVKLIKEEDKAYFDFNISYKNIDLDLHLYFENNDKKKLKKIFIDEFDRTTPGIIKPRPPTDPGDGALLLALTIIHFNEIYSTNMNNVFWEGDFTRWWFTHGPCSEVSVCLENEASKQSDLPRTTINNDNFLTWANKIYTEN
tara:strand:- start:53 stop:550 length:498 start_codon:yes stop_codon:yes gene_type:complete